MEETLIELTMKLKNMINSISQKKMKQFIFIKKKVIKFFSNKLISKNRYIKSLSNQKVFPKCKIVNNFYYYNFIEGETLYKKLDLSIFKELIKFLEKNLWKKKVINSQKFIMLCKNFYLKKTLNRIDLYKKKYPNYNINKINNKKIVPIDTLLNKINWNNIISGIPSFIHGDLQFDNIIFNNRNSFKLIDWRHSFDNSITIGDLYYDLSKMYGGLLIDYSEIKNNNFDYKEKKGSISLNLSYKKNYKEIINCYENYILKKRYNLKKIKIMTGIIYLNMAPLHEYPFDKFLFAFGINILDEQINDK